MWAHPGKQLLFMGSEFGQGAEWSADRGLDWWVLGDEHHAGLRQLVTDLNRAYTGHPALWALDYSPEGFGWIDANDAGGNVLSFLRFAGTPAGPGRAAADGATADGAAADGAAADGAAADGPAPGEAAPGMLACIVNFSGRPHLRYRVGLPRAGRWLEVINTDAFGYGGSGVGNLGAIDAVPEPWHGQPASAVMALPPLGALWLVPEA
jgi:1,4-alpha-glucan branching enzyme